MHFRHSLSKLAGSVITIGAVASVVLAGTGQLKVKDQSKSEASHRLNQEQSSFIENKGQWSSKALFLARTQNLDTWFTPSGLTFDYSKQSLRNGKLGYAGQIVKMNFEGSNNVHSVIGQGDSHYFSKFIPKKGGKIAIAKSYPSILSKDLYAGVDMRAYYDKGSVRYDLIAKPNSDTNKIKLSFDGASSLSVHGNKLSIGTQIGNFAQGNLFVYQLENGKKVTVPATFSKVGRNEVSFKIGKYDHSKSLVIDPVVYGTYFGGNDNWDDVRAVVADTSGGVYLTGSTRSTTFPVTTGPYFISLKGTQNAYVAKLQGDAYNVDYSVYFGGSNSDYGQFIQLDPFGNVWIAGVTTSPDFPGNTLTSSASNPSIFVIRFQKSTTLVLDPLTQPATLMLGPSTSGGQSTLIAGFSIVPVANPVPGSPVTLFLDGNSSAPTPQVTNGTFAGNPSSTGFLVEYTFNGTAFTRVASSCEYVGGEGLPTIVSGLAADSNGNAYVTGQVGDGLTNVDTSVSPGFTTTAGVFTGGRLIQKTDLFARKYNSAGGIVYSAIVGGSDVDLTGGVDFEEDGTPYTTGSCIAIDSLNNAYITGVTYSFDFPRTRGAYGQIFDGTRNVVVTKISNDASQIVYSTNLKTHQAVTPAGLSVDGSGQAFITGLCDSPNNPAQYNLQWPVPRGNPDMPSALGGPLGSIQIGSASSDAPPDSVYDTPAIPDMPTSEGWLTVLDPTGSTLQMGTYIGGRLDEKMYAPYVDSFGDVWVNGATSANRYYIVFGTGGPPPPQTIENDLVNTNPTNVLPANLITNLAFKSTDATDGLVAVPNVNYDTFGSLPTVNYGQPPFVPGGESRDGFLIKLRIGKPVVSSVSVTPGTIPGGLGQSALVQVTLSGPAPTGGATIALSLTNNGAASFSNSAPSTSLSVTIPAGATTFTAPVAVYSSAVSVNTQVLVKADYQGNFLISPLTVVPWLQNLAITPTAVVGGNVVTGTITLAQAAPTGGVVVQVSSSSSLLTVPVGGTVTIPAGQNSGTFTLTTGGVDIKTFANLNATLLGVVKTSQVELDAASLIGVSLNPNEIAGGSSVTGTVTLNGLPGPNFPSITVAVQGSPAGYSIVPATIPASAFNGTTSATFQVNTPFETTQVTRVVQATLTAVTGFDYQTATVSANLIVDSNSLIGFTLSANTFKQGDPALTGTLTLQNPAGTSGLPVSLTSSLPAYITVPATEIVTSGLTSLVFPIPVNNVAVTSPTTVVLTAQRLPGGPISQSVVLGLSTVSLTINTPSVLGGAQSSGTVTLSAPAAVDTPVNIQYSPSGYSSSPGGIVIPAGQASATFEIDTSSVPTTQEVSVTAHVGSLISNIGNLEIRAPGVSSIGFLPSYLRGGSTTICRITLDGPAGAGGAVISLSPSSPSVVSLPATITIPAGQTSYTFSVFVRRVSRNVTTLVTASYNGSTAQSEITAHR